MFFRVGRSELSLQHVSIREKGGIDIVEDTISDETTDVGVLTFRYLLYDYSRSIIG